MGMGGSFMTPFRCGVYAGWLKYLTLIENVCYTFICLKQHFYFIYCTSVYSKNTYN